MFENRLIPNLLFKSTIVILKISLDIATIDIDEPKPLGASQIGLFKGSRDLSEYDGEDNLIKVHANLAKLAAHNEGKCADYCIIDTSPAFGDYFPLRTFLVVHRKKTED